MANTIAEQNWEMIAAVNSSLRQADTSQKKGQELIAQTNRVIDLQQLEKDVILPADPHGTQASKEILSSNRGPQLPNPYSNWNGFQGQDEQQGLISIIGAVLALQAKTNSNFWSTLWKQASASMMMEVKFAPIVGNAITAQYAAQQLSTQAQADQSKYSGLTNLIMFGVAMGMAGYQEYTNPGEKLPEDPDIGTKIDPDADLPAEEEGAVNQSATQTAENQATESEITESKTTKSELKRAGKRVLAAAKKGQMKLTGFLGHGMQASMMMNMASQGMTGYFIDSKYQGEQATYTGQEGAQAALSKQSEMYSQFYGQDYSREEDLRQGTAQNIDYAMNILQQAANTITATVKSMFGG